MPDSSNSASFSKEEIQILAEIAKGFYFEPFEGSSSLMRIQQTQQGIKEKYDHYKSKTGTFVEKGKVIGKRQWDFLKEKAKDYLPDSKPEEISNSVAESVKSKAKNFLQAGIQTVKGISEEATQGVKNKSIQYIQNAFEILVNENAEEWVVGVSRATLERNDIFSFEDIHHLTVHERQILLDQNYPHTNPILKKYSEKFDYSINLVMGAIVASNLPFTGGIICLVNIAKTIVRAANRISTLSNFYGYPITSKSSLYNLITNILNSLNDWDNNPDHLPLSPDILKKLYVVDEEQQNFDKLLKQIIIRDHYIAIPLVGTVSLAKLNLDDFKLDIYIEKLFFNYFVRNQLEKKRSVASVQFVMDQFQSIYQNFRSEKLLEQLRKNYVKDRILSNQKKRWDLIDIDKEELKIIHNALISKAIEQYNLKNLTTRNP